MQENRKIVHVLIAVCLMFFVLIGYLTWFQLFVAAQIAENPYNRRHSEKENSTLRGSIFDRKGVLLAGSKGTGNTQERIYPFGALYSEIIGYSSKMYGKSLLEASYDNYLLNLNFSNPLDAFKEKLNSSPRVGNNLQLTLDNKLQMLADKLLDGKKGAVVAVNPKTGEILAMVSKPNFDPGEGSLINNWQELTESEDYPFLPRATQGLYAPGSTYKLVTGAAVIEAGLDNQVFDDNGSVVIDGKKFSNQGGKAHGRLDLTKALMVSSNVVFTQLGVQLGGTKLIDMAERVGMGKSMPFDIPVSKSIFPYESMSKTDMASVAMGQGKLLVTPLHMAMIVSGIANNGVMMKPFMVKSIESVQGKLIKTTEPSSLYRIMSPGIAGKIKQMMQQVVDSGTGKNARIPGIHVGGKTGTAENELSVKNENKAHTWFVSFAPVEDPEIAVAVIVEYSGSTGGTMAAPIAQQLMSAYLKGNE